MRPRSSRTSSRRSIRRRRRATRTACTCVASRARDDALAPAPDPLPPLVVEAFGCGLPASWLAAMEGSEPAPVWLNLEYLSAEPWIDGAHGLPSPHPTRRLTRWFLFPGFTPSSGGLLRERTLFAHRDAFTARPDHRTQPWTSLALPAPRADALTVSLFCYPTPVVATLLRTWTEAPRPVAVLVPEGVASEAVAAFAGQPVRAGDTIATGSLSLAVVPFVDPDAFDRRLWACDFAIVRGEDSFLRAQWAARPFAWHIYPTADDAHQEKLEAFLARYTAGLAAAAAQALRAFTAAFNAGDGRAVACAWPLLRDELPALARHARAWADERGREPDLATQLVDFYRSRL